MIYPGHFIVVEYCWFVLPVYTKAYIKGCDSNLGSHYEVNISNDKAEVYEKIMSAKLLVILILVFKHYPSIYCLTQCRCAICSNYDFIHGLSLCLSCA